MCYHGAVYRAQMMQFLYDDSMCGSQPAVGLGCWIKRSGPGLQCMTIDRPQRVTGWGVRDDGQLKTLRVGECPPRWWTRQDIFLERHQLLALSLKGLLLERVFFHAVSIDTLPDRFKATAGHRDCLAALLLSLIGTRPTLLSPPHVDLAFILRDVRDIRTLAIFNTSTSPSPTDIHGILRSFLPSQQHKVRSLSAPHLPSAQLHLGWAEHWPRTLPHALQSLSSVVESFPLRLPHSIHITTTLLLHSLVLPR